MFTILLHSSKTMHAGGADSGAAPAFAADAVRLVAYVASLPLAEIAKAMDVSPALAEKTHDLMAGWTEHGGLPAIDAFSGDIYSGFQAASLSAADRTYAAKTLFILSGLYGVLGPLDPVRPYRLEMAYRFPDAPYDNLYAFWGDRLARALPAGRTVINTSSAEYTKAVFPHLPDGARIITPKFLSMSSKTGRPTNVTVHTKIARGAFARWLITERVEDETRLRDFAELGYRYDARNSTDTEPVYVAKEFKGLGLSVRGT